MQSRNITMGVLILVLALFVGNSFASRRRDGDLQVARDSLAQAVRDDARQKSQVDFLTTRASLAEARADSAERAADSLSRVTRKAVVKYVTARDSAPADCAPVIQMANDAIDAAQEEADSLRHALQAEQSALADTKAARDSVVASNGRLRAAAVAVEQAGRPSRLIPRFGIGAAAGIDPFTRRPALATGVTLGWTF